jgi:tetrahydromethanopterin S-methyltransferase subunit C
MLGAICTCMHQQAVSVVPARAAPHALGLPQMGQMSLDAGSVAVVREVLGEAGIAVFCANKKRGTSGAPQRR